MRRSLLRFLNPDLDNGDKAANFYLLFNSLSKTLFPIEMFKIYIIELVNGRVNQFVSKTLFFFPYQIVRAWKSKLSSILQYYAIICNKNCFPYLCLLTLNKGCPKMYNFKYLSFIQRALKILCALTRIHTGILCWIKSRYLREKDKKKCIFWTPFGHCVSPIWYFMNGFHIRTTNVFPQSLPETKVMITKFTSFVIGIQ